MLSKELLKKIRRIQIVTTQLANDILAGAYHSAFKGRGMEFEEVREYQRGDDIRSVDWNVTARMNHPYVKTFREEREITVMLVVDISASSRFGSGETTKREVIAEIAAVLAFSAVKNNDNVSLILFSEEVELYLPPKKGLRHILRLIRELLATTAKHPGTNMDQALTFLGNVQKKRGICFVISDFICPPPAHNVTLLAKKHDLIFIDVTDPAEVTLPQMDVITIQDLETSEMQTLDTSEPATRKAFTKAAEERSRDYETLMKKVGGGYIPINTAEPYFPSLNKFFKKRRIRH